MLFKINGVISPALVGDQSAVGFGDTVKCSVKKRNCEDQQHGAVST
ncbi:hypothetical protein [Pantoea sp.]|nr:hypothetical protein [Pantoea sp.]